MNMIIYGTKIISDISFPLDFSSDSDGHYSLEFSSEVPAEYISSITCGVPFYQAHGRQVYLYSDRIPDCSEDGQPWCYEVKDVVRFYWRGGERTVFYQSGECGDAHLLCFWFVHLLLPLFFTLEGMYDFLHAGAVEICGRPVLFIAPSMGGKSTLTDYFIRHGHVLVSDDKVPTFIDEGRFMSAGSHPYHRPYRKFEELGYRVDAFMNDCKPIHAFYALERGAADADVLIEEVNGFEKFDTLLPNYLYTFSFLRPHRLAYLSSLLNRVRLFRVQMPWNMERQGEVYDAVCSHSNMMK
ncbi:MAG: hypothetical protein JRC87_03750 [Deltaproteobacteria bacterium]|nr:hypothetical protein [Deltaproteobacteria bacterium]